MLQIAVITAAVLLFITSIAVRWRKKSSSNSVHIKRLHSAQQLPMGSWSLPWIGESFSLYSQGPSQFCSQRIARYGRTFRTHLMGYPSIVTSTLEAAKFVLVTRHKSFAVFHPVPIVNLLSFPPATVLSQEMQAKLVKTIRHTTHSESLRNRIAKIDRITRWALSSWDKQPSCVVTYQETKKLAFHVILDFIVGMAPSPETMKMMDDYNYIIKGMGSFMQFNIPGTTYHMALKKKQKILEAFSTIVKKRRLEKSKEKFLIDILMEIETDNGEKMSDYALPFQLCSATFAGFHTSTVFFVWLVKFLGENQQILQEVKAEQETIRMGKISPEDPLSWTDIINMPLTLAVIQETLRLANIAPFVTRQATEDINYEGIRIPRRWLVKLDMENIHLNPKYHKDPLKFDPSRFQAPTKPDAFLPFGSGVRMCPGRDLAKFEACVFLHYLVTTYSWESSGSEKGVDYWPAPTVKGGLPIKVSKLSKCVT